MKELVNQNTHKKIHLNPLHCKSVEEWFHHWLQEGQAPPLLWDKWDWLDLRVLLLVSVNLKLLYLAQKQDKKL
ncbi:MAG: hypothetical protein EBZ77_05255 [Chitinophagia bacterium]|nr:hypothetical protein [Chitinophagia bacterium]